jgi:hypothetical protein
MTSNEKEESRGVRTYLVDPERLNSGLWCHKVNKTVGEGDIAASFSADRIAMNQPVRRTFPWQGSDWVCVGLGYSGRPLSYSERTSDGDSARTDSNGFYHGITAKHAGRTFVLCGPCARFEPGETVQFSLFA